MGREKVDFTSLGPDSSPLHPPPSLLIPDPAPTSLTDLIKQIITRGELIKVNFELRGSGPEVVYILLENLPGQERRRPVGFPPA